MRTRCEVALSRTELRPNSELRASAPRDPRPKLSQPRYWSDGARAETSADSRYERFTDDYESKWCGGVRRLERVLLKASNSTLQGLDRCLHVLNIEFLRLCPLPTSRDTHEDFSSSVAYLVILESLSRRRVLARWGRIGRRWTPGCDPRTTPFLASVFGLSPEPLWRCQGKVAHCLPGLPGLVAGYKKPSHRSIGQGLHAERLEED